MKKMKMKTRSNQFQEENRDQLNEQFNSAMIPLVGPRFRNLNWFLDLITVELDLQRKYVNSNFNCDLQWIKWANKAMKECNEEIEEHFLQMIFNGIENNF